MCMQDPQRSLSSPPNVEAGPPHTSPEDCDLGAANDPADEAADYFDLVTAIEKAQDDVALGSWNGVFSTCRDVGIVVPDFGAMDLAPLLGGGA